MKIERNRLIILGLLLSYFILMEFAYVFFIDPDYPSFAFTVSFHWPKFILGVFIFLATLIHLAFNFKSEFLLAVASLIVGLFLTPNLVLFQFMNAPLVIVMGIEFILICIPLLDLFLRRVKLPTLKENYKTPVMLMLATLFLIPFIITYGKAINLQVLKFEDIYVIRAKSEQIQNLFTGYLYSPLSYWILPILLLTGYLRKSIGLVLFALAGLLYLYLITGNKITFFTIFTVTGFYFFKSYSDKIIKFYAFIIVLFGVGLLLSITIGDTPIEDMLMRRFLYLPALLNIQYLEFFDHNPMYLSHSILSHWLDYPFDYPPPRQIGMTYYHGGNLTNGIISDGFLNFGILGIFLYCFVAALLVVYFDRLKINPAYFGLFFLLVQNFVDNALLTSFLTHGVFLFVVIGSFVLADSIKQEKKALKIGSTVFY